MSKHAPAPWFSHREGFSTVYIEARIAGGVLQEVAACGPSQEGPEQQEANARLIAAAPELLEALENLVHWNILRGGDDDMPLSDEHQPKEIRYALSIIRKARGES